VRGTPRHVESIRRGSCLCYLSGYSRKAVRGAEKTGVGTSQPERRNQGAGFLLDLDREGLRVKL